MQRRRRSRRSARSPRGNVREGWALVRRVTLIMAVMFVIGDIVSGIVIGYAEVTLPPLSDIGTQTGTITIEDSSGNVITTIGRNGVSNSPVPLSQISPYLQEATIATEDRDFYSEGAFDPARIIKSAFIDATSGSAAQGASTITEQLAKIVYFGYTPGKSALTKLREALLANEISQSYTKKEILDKYLNLLPYGENSYGIGEASERFFGVTPSQLTLAEASLLAGLPQAPSYYDPYLNPTAAWERQHTVLESMVSVGDITQAQANAVDPLVGGYSPTSAQKALQTAHQQELITLLQNGSTGAANPGPAPHFVQYVEGELSDDFQNDPSALSGNLTVITTLNLAYQEKADEIIHNAIYGPDPIGGGANNAALLMIDPTNGAIEVMVGSSDYDNNAIDGQFNVVTGLRQPGSTFKPFVYETGFINGTLTPDTILNDTAAQSALEGGVQDWNFTYEGEIQAQYALLGSRNIPTEQAMSIAGINNVIDFAHSAGITTPISPNISSAIGTSAVHMIDITSAYAAFANGGHVVKPYAIEKVIGANGQVLINNDATPNYGSIMTPYQAWEMDHILVNYPATWDVHFKYETAGKDGTTDNFDDAWWISFTPSWVISTWVGHTSEADPGELPMDNVWGSTQAPYTVVPFVDSLPQPAEFSKNPPTGSCSSCQTNSPVPVASSSSSTTPGASPSASGSPSPTPLPTPTPTPIPTSCPLGPGGNPTCTPGTSPSP